MLKKNNIKFWQLKHIQLDFINFKTLKAYAYKIIMANLVKQDMVYMVKSVRQVKGYPSNGQTSHTNASSCRKNKKLFNYRLQQFYDLLGKKRRDIYPTMIQAEYYNRLWYVMWRSEWVQGRRFLISLCNKKNQIPFDPVNLARGQTNGFKRVGHASKLGKAKKITKQGTIGAPFFFTRNILQNKTSKAFPFTLQIPDDSRKKMGKKTTKKRRTNKPKKKKNE